MTQAAFTCRKRNAGTDGRRTGIGIAARQKNRTALCAVNQKIAGLIASDFRTESGTFGRTRERQCLVVRNVNLRQGISDADIIVVAAAARQHIVVVTGCDSRACFVNDILAEVRAGISTGELQIFEASNAVRGNQCLERIEAARFKQVRLIQAAHHIAAGRRHSNVQNRTRTGRKTLDNQLSKLIRAGAEAHRPFKNDRAVLNRQILEGIYRFAAACNSQR